MKPSLLLLPILLAAVGCAPFQRASIQPAYPNPVLIPSNDYEYVWEQMVDVVNDDFRIIREERVRQVGNMLTEGLVETEPLVGATLLEPWRGDSASSYERLESTLQTIRRRSIVRMIPSQGGFLVDVAVFKELEDLKRPKHSTVGEATFRSDQSLERFREPVGEFPQSVGWIPLGRDVAAEQRILQRLMARFQ